MNDGEKKFYKYRLCGIDSDHKLMVFYESETIFEMDCFTSSNFLDKEDMYKKIEEKYKKKFSNIFIETRGRKQMCSHDIMFCKNLMPENDRLCDIYTKYLLEDRKRIRSSFYYYMPRFKGDNVYTISENELILLVKSRINSYKKRRNVYFELLKNKKIKEVEIVKKDSDYLKTIIDNIEFDDSKIGEERLSKEDVMNISRDIMLGKVISGEEEMFDYFNLEDYTRYDTGKKGPKR